MTYIYGSDDQYIYGSDDQHKQRK